MKPALGIIAILIAFYSYIPYFKDIFAGKTKPHAFSWFVWFLLTAIAFVAQVHDKGGPGAWATGFTAAVAFAIFVAAIKVGKKNIVPIDWLFLAGALIAMALWVVTHNPTGSVILITIIDMLAFVPTFRKSFHKPREETVVTYSLSALKFAIAIAALTRINVVTALYPLSLVITNSLFVVMVLSRRHHIKGSATESF